MPYSVFVGVALAIHILINIDMFRKKDQMKAVTSYRWFLIAITAFYITDILWGIFHDNKLVIPTIIDTFVYFLMMGATIMLWTEFVVRFLDGHKLFSRIVKWIGVLFFIAEIVLLVVNFFSPILFTITEDGTYISYIGRDVMLWTQIGMYSLLAIYSIAYAIATHTKAYRRFIAITLFSVGMCVCIAIQLTDPLIPFYSIGLLIGVCILDVYALDDTKEQYKEITEEKEEKLEEVTTIAFTDPLTKVKSRFAYISKEIEIDKAISNNEMEDFAVVVFDLNGLKTINDKKGHDAGDKYLVDSANLIRKYYKEDNLYRYGGDEFVVILTGEEVKKRQQLHKNFMKAIDENTKNNRLPIISSGMSIFKKESDFAVKSVFYRADKMMYARKDELKEHR